jgi:hypothetical protein
MAVALVAGATAVFALYWQFIRVPQERNARFEMEFRRSTECYWFMIARVQGRLAQPGPSSNQDSKVADRIASSWEEYLVQTCQGKYPDYQSWTCFQSDNFIVLQASSGRESIRTLWVIIPEDAAAVAQHLVLAHVLVSVNNQQRAIVLAYSPLTSDHIYAAKARGDVDLNSLLPSLTEGQDWRQTFNPGKSMWTHMYRIQSEYPPFASLEPRE